MAQVFEKTVRARARVRHSVLENQIGDIGKAERLHFPPPESEHPHDVLTLVQVSRGRPPVKRAIETLPNRRIVEIGHHGEITRRLQSETPSVHARRLSALP